MKKFLFILATVIIATAFSCSVHTRTNQTENKNTYQIKKIKKKNDWYFIYAAQNGKIFLILSLEPKDKTLYSHYPMIHRNGCYRLSLDSFRYVDFESLGRRAPSSNLHISGVQLDSITTIVIDRKIDGYYIDDFLFTDDLKGLYYIREKQ